MGRIRWILRQRLLMMSVISFQTCVKKKINMKGDFIFHIMKADCELHSKSSKSKQIKAFKSDLCSCSAG